MAKASRGGPGSKTPASDPADEGFLGRWSRRKAEARTPEDGHDDRPAADLTDEREAGLTEAEPDQVDQQPAAVDPATLPDIDKMEAGSDFSVFMQAGVPQALKTKALRKLWRVKPELANLDGLIDYGEDLTGSFKVVDHLKTAYEVGKGFLKEDEEPPPKDETADAEMIAEQGEISAEAGRSSQVDDTDQPVAGQDPSAEHESKG